MSFANPTLEDVWKMFQEMRDEMRQALLEIDRKFQEITEERELFGNKLDPLDKKNVYIPRMRFFKKRGIDLCGACQDIRAEWYGEVFQLDMLVFNNTVAIAIGESLFEIEHVDEYLEYLDKLKRVFPAHANKQVMGAVTDRLMSESVALYAYKKGLFVIGQTGEQLEIKDDLKFNPRIW